MDGTQAAAFMNALPPHPAVVAPIHYGSIVGSFSDADAFAVAVDPAITITRKIER